MRGLRFIVLTVFASNLTVAGLTFLFQVLLARWLTVDEFGRISLLLALIAIVQTILVFGFPASAVVHFGKARDRRRAAEGLNGWFLTSLVLVILITMPVVMLLDQRFYFSGLERAVLMTCVVSLHIYEYRLTRRQKQGLWSLYNRGLIANAVLRVCLGFAAAWAWSALSGTPLTIRHILWGYLAWSGIILLIGVEDWRRWSGTLPPWRLTPGDRRAFLLLILNLGLTDTFAIVSMRAANLVIEDQLGSRALGIYAAANTLALIMPVLTNSMMRVFVREAVHSGTRLLSTILAAQRRYALLVIAITVVAVALAKPMILLIFGPRYAESADLFRWLLVAYIGGVVFTPLESYFYAHRQSFVMIVKGLQMVIIVVGCYVAVRQLGLPGVPIALILARLVGWTAFLLAARRHNISNERS